MGLSFARSFLIFMGVCFTNFHAASADEKIGTTEVEMIRVRPTWLVREDDGSQFSFSDSVVGLRWRRDKELSAFIGIGSELSRNLPVYYTAPNEDKLGFYEAYAEYVGIYGTIRFGLLPLNFGYDGVLSQDERHFNRSLPFTKRAIGLSDQGMSFATENNGYYTELIAHNGEIDTTSDGRLWLTGNWGYSNGHSLRMQASLQSGFVKGEVSHLNPENTLGGVTNGVTAHWRNGLFFVNWSPRDWNVVMQYGGGEFDQGKAEGRYSSTMFEAYHLFSKYFGSGFRYDEFDPNRKLSGDKITEASVVFVFKSEDSTSEVCVLGTKVFEQHDEINNDQLRLVWSLTPVVH